MKERPELSSSLDDKTFQSYYYLKQELVDFCKAIGMDSGGGKLELTQRIATYLQTGQKPKKETKKAIKAVIPNEALTKESRIEPNFVCSERHRAFFEQEIGKGFSFYVAFQKWLKENTGKTYEEAITAYTQLKQEKKQKKTSIDQQFEYNTYIRDFFADNKGKALEQAIQCWKYKKSLPGSNKYERTDLMILNMKEQI